MPWKPLQLPAEPTSPAESDTSIECAGCGAPVGEPCRTTACGTYDPPDAR